MIAHRQSHVKSLHLFVVIQEMVLSVIPRQPHYEKKFYFKKNCYFSIKKKKKITTYFIIITDLKTLSMAVFCNNRQAFLNKLQKQLALLVLHCIMGRFQSGLQSFKMAALEEELQYQYSLCLAKRKSRPTLTLEQVEAI